MLQETVKQQAEVIKDREHVPEAAERPVSKADRCLFTEDFLKEVLPAEILKRSKASIFIC